MDDLSPPPPSTGSGQGPSTLRQSSGQAGSGQSFFSLPVFFGFAAGIFAGVALALLAFLAFYLLREEEDAASSPAPLALPSPVATAASSDASEPRTVSALSVHIGPSEGYAALGTLRRGETLQIVGRSADATWLAVRFPPGSNGLGWVPLNGVSGVADVQRLPQAFPPPPPGRRGGGRRAGPFPRRPPRGRRGGRRGGGAARHNRAARRRLPDPRHQRLP